MKIVVTTQSELDAIKLDFNGEIVITGGTVDNPIKLKEYYADVILSGNAVVSMYGKSQVKEMWGSSQGDMYINRVNNPGHFLLRCDGQYHYMSIAKFLPLEKVGKGVEKLLTKVFRMVNKNSPSFVFSVSNQIANAFPLALRRSVGYKMEVAYWQELSRRAAAVAINISFKGWKGK